MKIISMNPATDVELATFEGVEIDEATELAYECRRAQQQWRGFTIKERCELLKKLGELTKEHAQEFGTLATQEMGKPITQAVAEVEKCAQVCEYYAENAAKHLENESIKTEAKNSYVRFEPLGVLLTIMPWNFPFWQVYRAAVPAIAAGNGIILKHASNVPQCALKIAEIFEEAGFPKHLFTTLLTDAETANQLIEKDLVDCVTLTGSTAAGSAVASNAGKHLKKIVLELGGSDPFIVLEDANLEVAANTAIIARNQNNGQSCIAAKRFIVQSSVFEEFSALLLKKYAALKIGDPADPTVTIGPLAKKEFRDQIAAQVDDAVAQKARVLVGGKSWGDVGAFYEPTIITDLKPEMRIYAEETFGPVLSLYRIGSPEEAVALANSSAFGLGASIWTQDLSLGEELAAQIDSGAVFINGMVRSDVRMPFGGIKKSGYGRELGSYGIREFVNIKTVVINEIK